MYIHFKSFYSFSYTFSLPLIAAKFYKLINNYNYCKQENVLGIVYSFNFCTVQHSTMPQGISFSVADHYSLSLGNVSQIGTNIVRQGHN